MPTQQSNQTSTNQSGIPRYQIRLAAKIPSTVEQYRMLEASVTISGDDFEDCRTEAKTCLAVELADTCILMGEVPPEELKDTLKAIWSEDPEFVDQLYNPQTNTSRT